MSSIRPLITITILVVVGVVLYVKINEGTPRPEPVANGAWNQPAEDVPPLATSSVAPTTSDGAAPPWPATTPAPTSNAPAANAAIAPTAATPATAAAAPLPAVPAIPEMPKIEATTQADSTPTPPADPLSAAPPANNPEARYSGQAPATEAATPGDATIGSVPPVNDATAATAPIPETSIAAQEAATTPEQMNEATAATSGIPSTPAPLEANPLRPSTQSTPPDRYGADAAATTPIEAAAPVAPTGAPSQTFAESWPAIQAALDRGDLAEGHKLLSRWHGDPSLTPTDAERVETLLSQLAGTVLYSTEHRLAPAHVVKQGETLETIAKEYNVPWQLLAKINGVAAADQVRAGQELKVVRGPFEAVVDLGRNQMTLMVDGRYAGKFPVSVAPNDPPIKDGEWVVVQKSNPEAPGSALALQGPGSPGSPPPTIVIIDDSLPVQSAGGSIIKVAAKDADEIVDILSVGSRVVTRR